MRGEFVIGMVFAFSYSLVISLLVSILVKLFSQFILEINIRFGKLLSINLACCFLALLIHYLGLFRLLIFEYKLPDSSDLVLLPGTYLILSIISTSIYIQSKKH